MEPNYVKYNYDNPAKEGICYKKMSMEITKKFEELKLDKWKHE